MRWATTRSAVGDGPVEFASCDADAKGHGRCKPSARLQERLQILTGHREPEDDLIALCPGAGCWLARIGCVASQVCNVHGLSYGLTSMFKAVEPG